jgi:hypothetical protein
VLIDNLQKGKVDIYVIYSNCTMRKFTSAVVESQSLSFEECIYPYNLEQAFREGQGLDKNVKKINLFEQYKGDMFVANHIFYSKFAVIDLAPLKLQDKY